MQWLRTHRVHEKKKHMENYEVKVYSLSRYPWCDLTGCSSIYSRKRDNALNAVIFGTTRKNYVPQYCWLGCRKAMKTHYKNKLTKNFSHRCNKYSNVKHPSWNERRKQFISSNNGGDPVVRKSISPPRVFDRFLRTS